MPPRLRLVSDGVVTAESPWRLWKRDGRVEASAVQQSV